MATSFTIHKIDFGNAPSGTQNFSFYYKLWSAPESGYILIDSGVPVATNGTVLASPPISVTGLVAGELYYLKAANECDSPVDFIVIPIQL